ncbi:MAG TPA: efflux RND transporter permease subunit [Candidatus Wallbacteria bacterium]|nr:efflux RND transporter permease subunit [Candidatus Wallbacteria bacterium]
MILSEVSIKRPVFITMVTAVMVLFGAISYGKIGVNLFPDIEMPMATVVTVLRGASPETVEMKVTDKIEEAVNTINGVKKVTSYSLENVSQVVIEFDLDKKIDIVAQDVRDKVSGIRSTLPLDIEEPIIEKIDVGAAAIMSVVYSAKTPIGETTRYAKDVIKERLQKVPGVGSVKIIGGLERQIRVWVSTEKMLQHGVTIEDVKRALTTENVEIPGGKLETGNRDIVVKVKGEIENFEEFKDLYIGYKNGYAVTLGDVARIEDGLEDRVNYATLNGVEAVSLQIKKQSGTNIVKVADAVKAEIEKIRKSLEPGSELKVVADSSKFVKLSFNEVLFHLFFGGGLAIIIVFVFLRNIRTTLISAVALPTSVVTTFALMKYLDFTFNNLTMLALSLSIGMLIDDAIVVLENIYRHQEEEGKDPMEAAVVGTAEIGLAVLATTFAIVVVFVPVAIMEGLIGKFFYEFGMTVTFAVLVSLFVSFTMTPMLCSRYMKLVKTHGAMYNFVEAILKSIENVYISLLKLSLKFRMTVIIISVVMLAASLYSTKYLKSEFLPKQDKDQFNVVVETPTGSSIEYTASAVATIENILKSDKRIVSFFSTIGADSQEKSNTGSIYVELIPKSQRMDADQFEIMAECREKFKDIKGMMISVEEAADISMGSGRQAVMQFGLAGPDLKQLEAYSKQMAEEMKKDGGFVDIDTDYKAGKPEARVYINRNAATRLYVPIASLASAIRTMVGGEKVSKFKDGGNQYDINLRLELDERKDLSNIENYFVRSQSGAMVDLKNLVTINEESGPSMIARTNRQRQISFYSNLKGISSGEGLEKVKGFMKKMNVKPGYSMVLIGKLEKMQESFQSIFFAMGLGIVLMYMIIASQFESFIHPFTIMISLPLSMIGAIGGLLLFGKELSIISLIGMIMLMGLVAKNAILLVDYTATLRARGFTLYDAIIKAGPTRLRPILMTTAAMVFGMLPIAFAKGSGSEMQSPMAICVIGGLITSTILTLVVVPVVYSLIEDMLGFVRGTAANR